MKCSVVVSQTVEVTVDETKFTPEFLAEFRESFYLFDGIEDHVKHLAQMHARGIADEWRFIEGYGKPAEMGIKFRITEADEELLDDTRRAALAEGENQK